MRNKCCFLLVMAFAMLGAISCEQRVQTQKEQESEDFSFSGTTQKNLYRWIDKNIYNPKEFRVESIDKVWDTDSLCVLNVAVYGENTFGGHFEDRIQYLNIVIGGSVYEWCDLNVKDDGVLSRVKDPFKLEYMERKGDPTLMQLEEVYSDSGIVFRNAYVNACPDISGAMMFESGNIVGN